MPTPQPLPRWGRWFAAAVVAALTIPIAVAVRNALVDDVRDASVFEATIEGDQLTLSIESCNAEEIDVVVEELDDEVVVAARVVNPADGEDCADGATVTLDAPLGDRRIVDAVTGRALRCEPDGEGRSYCQRER